MQTHATTSASKTHPRQRKRGSARRGIALWLSTAAGIGVGGVSAARDVGLLATSWRKVSDFANVYDVGVNACACAELIWTVLLAGIGRAMVLTFALIDALRPLLYFIFVLVVLRIFSACVSQLIAHAVLKAIELRLAREPNDKTVVESAGVGEAAFLVDPTMNTIVDKDSAWSAIRRLAARLDKHPVDVANHLRVVRVATATVHDCRLLAAYLRRQLLNGKLRELVDQLQMRSIDLADYPDNSFPQEERRGSRAVSEDDGYGT